MARTSGARNAKYEEQRLRLARKIRGYVMGRGGLEVSLRGLARAADTSVANLRHYFGDRIGVMKAVLESLFLDAAPHLARAAAPTHQGLKASVTSYLKQLHKAWFAFGVGRAQALSLASGLASQALGPHYVNYILEPLLGSAEALLRLHMEKDQMPKGNPRYAALELLAPVVVALLHQDSLAGASCRPLDLDDFFAVHVNTFMVAYGAPGSVVVAKRPRTKSRRAP